MHPERTKPRAPELPEADFQIWHREVPATEEPQDQRAHRHAFQEIIFIEQGSAKHTIDTAHDELQGPFVALIAQGKVHRFIPKPWTKLYVLRFTNEFLPRPVEGLFSQVVDFTSLAVYTSELQYKIKSLFELMHQEYQQAEPNKVYIRHLLSALLSVLREEQQKRTSGDTAADDSNYSTFSKFLALLDAEFTRHRSVEYYAGQLNITTKKLGELSKAITGDTPSRIIEKRVILAAKRFLIYTTDTVQEIAYTLGYTDHSHFTRAFRRLEGVTPTAFRIQYRQA
ncbi:helix-turn-helix domain-containing protein [Pontibacter sp. Tf4]|uniref:helix-turn-helix domain-containing protein n=1 Tax=Pontibacter sp. Tf4 TaxID=2761620 RepID=UPI001623C13C|nr:helix-turn-helix domain-containing protein [Pontibacter sp. Tf4]MBB6612519.1 helix-turn-helix domain-containing protein [Pontibacter sp. Tf4]